MKINLHSPVEEVQIQIIPLIDVVFCILTFFLLAALQFTRQQAINVDLPKASTGTSANVSSQAGREILPVTIDAIGQTYVEKEPIRREQLKAILEDYVKKNPNGVLVLNASRSATYSDVIGILDLLREVGGDRVSLGIIPGSSETPTNLPQPTSPNFPLNPTTPGIPSPPDTSLSAPFNPGNPPNPPASSSGTAPVLPQAPTGGQPNSTPNR